MKMDSCSTFHFLESSSNSSSLVETSWNVLAMTKKESAVSCLNCAISNSFSKLKFEQIETKEGMREEKFTNAKRSFFKVEREFLDGISFFFFFFLFFNCRRVNELASSKFKLRKSSSWVNPVFPSTNVP